MQRTASVISRRAFLSTLGVSCLADSGGVIDIHQHTVYGDRDAEMLVKHQRTMGISKTVLLPVGTRPGLKPGAGGNQSAAELVTKYPKEYVFFANAIPNEPNAQGEIEKYLKAGAIGIGEQKYG